MADPQMDVHTAAQMLADTLALTRGTPLPLEVAKANEYLTSKLMNYFVMMRQLPQTESISFMIPAGRPLQEAGWYYRSKGLKREAFNWNGPFASRKECQDARDKLKGQPRTSYEVLEREIFGEVIGP